MFVGYWDDFVFNHVREMKSILPVLCKDLAKSLYKLETGVKRCFPKYLDLEEALWKTMIVLLRGPCSFPQDTSNIPGALCCVLYTTHYEGLESWRYVMLPFSKTYKLRLGTLV